MRISADKRIGGWSPDEQILRHDDIQSINQLIEGCHERGDDCAVWMQFLIRRLLVLLNAENAFTGQFESGRAGAEAPFRRARYFVIPAPADRDLFEDCEEAGATSGIVIRRALTLPTNGDRLTGVATITCDSGLRHFVVLTRSPRQPPFTSFDAALLKYILERIAESVGRSLADFREPRPSELPPRVRQVLVHLLAGKGAKQIAADLKISVHTVNQYVACLFDFYGVKNRAELMARWIERGWKPHVIRNDG